MLKYKSDLYEIFETVFFVPMMFLGFKEQKQSLVVELVSNYNQNPASFHRSLLKRGGGEVFSVIGPFPFLLSRHFIVLLLLLFPVQASSGRFPDIRKSAHTGLLGESLD